MKKFLCPLLFIALFAFYLITGWMRESSPEAAMRRVVEGANRDIAAHVEAGAVPEGFMYVESRGSNTVVFIFTAYDEETEDMEHIRIMADLLTPVYSALPLVMQEDGGIDDPRVLFEFLSMDGQLLYIREFTIDAAPGDIMSWDDISIENMLLETHQTMAAFLEEELEGSATVRVALQEPGTIIYTFKILDYRAFIELEFGEELDADNLFPRGNYESWLRAWLSALFLPEFGEVLAGHIPAMEGLGVENPSFRVEFLGPDSTLLAYTEVS